MLIKVYLLNLFLICCTAVINSALGCPLGKHRASYSMLSLWTGLTMLFSLFMAFYGIYELMLWVSE
jgi:hypothetical protein